MARYANSFWSPDYASGIEKLSTLLMLSLAQLHELRKFVFGYMKYFHANGEYLANLADTSYPIDSSFRKSRGPKTSRIASGLRQVSRTNRVETEPDLDMDYVFRQFIERTRQDLRLHQRAASDIDQLILEKLTAFLKLHEPQVRRDLTELDDLFQEYGQIYDELESAKQTHMTIARLGEFLIHKEPEARSEPEPEPRRELTETEDKSDEEISLADLSEYGVLSYTNFGIVFPIVIAGVPVFTDHQSFLKFIAALVKTVPITKRKIPLPGYRNEIFSSEQLCDAMKKEKPRGFNPTRSSLEKLGQHLLDSKIIVGTGFFAKKFSSENMWFEWSELAMSSIENDSQAKSIKHHQEHHSSTLPKFDETWNNMTSNTSKTFNGMFKSMQNSLNKARYSEDDLIDSEKKYNEAYAALQKQKHLLEMQILSASKNMEQFEKLKIELVYQSLTRLLQILQATSSQFSAELGKFCQKFVSELNVPENYALEFNKNLDTFSTGVYFPSLLAPNHTSRHVSTSQLNTNFQNIKLNFNLYQDIPLQSRIGDSNTNLPLSLHSVPTYLFEALNSLDRFPRLELSLAWKLPINYQQYWLMKDNLLNKIQNFGCDGDEVVVTHATEQDLLKLATTFLDDKDVSRLVNFVKNWLLEISDSIIPSTVHDSLIAAYKISRNNDADGEQRLSEALKVLGTMPRSNLSSLLYILEHMARTFDLDLLKGFGKSDELEETEASVSHEVLSELSLELNSLDAIAAVPFLHLIMRPSVVKHAAGYRPPMEQYNILLADLLCVTTRHRLWQALIASERHYIERKEQQKHNLGIHKIKEARERSASVNSSTRTAPQIAITKSLDSQNHPDSSYKGTPVSPKPVKSENFELRPFRTGATPRPSPSASPIASKNKSLEPKKPLAPLKLELEKP